MSLVKSAIESLVQKGKITHDFEVQGVSFSMQILSTEEQLIADSMVDPEYLSKKYKTKNLNTFRDTMDKHRVISQMALAIRNVNGESPIDTSLSLEEQFKQRAEFKEEISNLDVVTLDRLIFEYNQLIAKQREFMNEVKENAKK